MTRIIAWLPLFTLPTAVVLLHGDDWHPWAYMWLIAGALFVGCKWLTWYDALPANASFARHLGYLFAWPGLDAPAFLQSSQTVAPPLGRWWFALGKFVLGIGLLWGVVPLLPRSPDWLRGWVGMVGIVFILHFGVFHLLCMLWQQLGVNARPLMNWPVRAESVSDFWGKRWNTAFRDLTHRYLFRPLTAKLGGRWAVFVGFFFSGLIHELVISVPAGGGYGLPTVFFLIQGGALFLERSPFGKRLGLGSGLCGWAFTMATLLGTVVLLFHPPFVSVIVVPFVDWMISPLSLWERGRG